MESCLKFLPRKSYNTLGLVILTIFVSIGVVIIGIASDFESKTTLQCNPDKTLASDLPTRKYIETQCFLKYAQEFYSFFPLYVMFVINFGLVLLLSIIYAYWVKHRVEIFVNPSREPANDAHEESQPLSGSISPATSDPMAHRSSSSYFVFTVYILHLIICRILPLVVFAALLLNSMNFPDQFHCRWPMNSMSTTQIYVTEKANFSTVDCTYPMGSQNEKLSTAVITINLLYGTEAFMELAYLLWSAWKDRSLLSDIEFCSVYLLRKRKGIRKFLGMIRENTTKHRFYLRDDFGERELSTRKLEEIYTNVIIQEGRESSQTSRRLFKNRHERYEAHLKAPKDATPLRETSDLFKPKGIGKAPKAILVVGRPGIGKTLLTKKIFNEWQEQASDFWHDKIVILLQFRAFQHGKTSLWEMLKHGHGLNMSSSDVNGIYEHICLMPSNFVLIFDGLDELKYNETFSVEQTSVNNPNEVADIFQIFKQLVEGKLLPGATVLTTSRPTAGHVYKKLPFDRQVEILGFKKEQIKSYVERFCRNDTDKSTKLWKYIEESPELLSLSYIPVNCYIIVLTLNESIGGESFQSNVPRTITELYKRAIKVLLFRHHTKYKSEDVPDDYFIADLPEHFQNDLDELKKIAWEGMKDDKLIFEFPSHHKFMAKLSDCGIFNKLQDKRRNWFCFLHLTIQEFLAAQHVVDDMGNVESFLIEHINESRWHLVIQFVAGLIGDKIRDLKEERKTSERYG